VPGTQIYLKKNMPNKHKHFQKPTSKELQIKLLRHLLAHPDKRYAATQLIDSLSLNTNKDAVTYALGQLIQMGSVYEVIPGKYTAALDKLIGSDPDELVTIEIPKVRVSAEREGGAKPRPQGDGQARSGRAEGRTVTGRVDMARSGVAYIITEDLEQDVFIAPRNMGSAMHGDTVQVVLSPSRPMRSRDGGPPAKSKPEGFITAIIKRATESIIGTFRKRNGKQICISDNLAAMIEVIIPVNEHKNAQDGEKVVVKIMEWPEDTRKSPIGTVTRLLGKLGGNDFEMNKILITNGFDLDFPPEVEAESEAIPVTISPQEIALRRDFRDILTFTVDPEDAKDFDDALSYQVLENGNLEIGVHIADVTYYLKPGSALDQEAYKRSTSVYLVDRVCPMLPEKLSNNLCSLVPLQDRPVFSAVFEFDKKGTIVSRWFGKSMIHSDKRFAYEEAQTIIDGTPTEGLLEHPLLPELTEAILTLNKLALQMRKNREKDGAISFETEEVRFRLAPDGSPIEVYVKERKAAHMLIEDFMLLANKEVALYIETLSKDKQRIPFVYRVHDLPNMDKVAEFARFALDMGVKMVVDKPEQIAKSYNTFMKAAQEDPRLKILEPLAIRTMAKAVYTTENIGHYGLGFTHYSHFTSPIRRYSDVIAHRILDRNLSQDYRMDISKLEEMCKHVSTQEKRAADSERESIKYKQAEMIASHVGEVFEGILSGFIERGMFVALKESRAEGMVEFKFLDDMYRIDESRLKAVGARYGKVFKMGDTIRVRIAGVDLTKRQIEMEFVS
jgi:ribonuclease R